MNYSDLQVQVLGHRSAMEYVRTVCAEDWHEFGQLLSIELESATGSVRSLLPANIDVDAELNFRRGGITSKMKSLQWIAGLSCEHLGRSLDNLLFAQDSLGERNDPVMKKRTPLVHFDGRYPYYVCNAASTREQVDAAFWFSVHLPWSLAILTHLPTSDVASVFKDEQIEPDILRSSCHNASTIIVGGAFDGEGVLVWERQSVELHGEGAGSREGAGSTPYS